MSTTGNSYNWKVTLDVGGVKFVTTRRTLMRSGHFHALLLDSPRPVLPIFLDRCSHGFQNVLEALRDFNHIGYLIGYPEEIKFYDVPCTELEYAMRDLKITHLFEMSAIRDEMDTRIACQANTIEGNKREMSDCYNEILAQLSALKDLGIKNEAIATSTLQTLSGDDAFKTLIDDIRGEESHHPTETVPITKIHFETKKEATVASTLQTLSGDDAFKTQMGDIRGEESHHPTETFPIIKMEKVSVACTCTPDNTVMGVSGVHDSFHQYFDPTYSPPPGSTLVTDVYAV